MPRLTDEREAEIRELGISAVAGGDGEVAIAINALLDEVERLRAENTKAVAALKSVKEENCVQCDCMIIAHQTLKEIKG